ncbi:MAG: DUF5668 domain-containing protein [Bacteroidales bacterium]|nr:DUF5668 domain-containing protein [Bacteroidales bacterium]
MRKREHHDHNPVLGIGAFLIGFGLFMAIIMLDLFDLGDPREYIMWQTLVLFIGVISLFKGKIVSALILLLVGTYFLLPELNIEIPEFIDTIYWPVVIVIAGVAFIISGIFRRTRKL